MDELKILLVKNILALVIDDKPTTNYHDGRIIVDNSGDLRLITDNKGAFDVAHWNGPSKGTKHMDVNTDSPRNKCKN